MRSPRALRALAMTDRASFLSRRDSSRPNNREKKPGVMNDAPTYVNRIIM